MAKWDARFIEMAHLVASWSKDPSTKCGAVITDKNNRIISVGFNGFARGVNDDPEIYADRPEKYRRVIHAERNAILFAQRDLTDCNIYVVPMPPCAQCAGMIIQAGITNVVTVAPTEDQMERWGEDINSTWMMFREAGVELVLFAQDHPDKPYGPLKAI